MLVHLLPDLDEVAVRALHQAVHHLDHVQAGAQRAVHRAHFQADDAAADDEETHCDVPEATLRAALQSVAVFDHPDRSQRGRTITHAHYFDLGNAPLPAVQADDDALQAEWIPVGQIAALEAEFFEDHFHMLDHFLQITGLVGSAG